MTNDERARGVGPVAYNVDRILDAHTHLTGQESAEEILECIDACGVEKAFVFAPMLNVQAHENYQRQPRRHTHSHWQSAIRETQNPRPAPEPIEAPDAHHGRSHA